MAERVRFEAPPVMEVVCGVLFGSLSDFRVPHVGLFWNLVRSEFPLIDEVPPLPPQLEGGEQGTAIQIEISPQLPRTWMRAQNGGSLLQLQRDRFLYNWKRSNADQSYPSYDHVIVEFERFWTMFQEFVGREKLGTVVPRQYELTYINHIPAHTVPANDPLFVDHTRDGSRKRFLPEPESYLYRIVYQLPQEAGRLSVSAGTGRELASGEELIRLDMTARGLLGAGSADMTRGWFDLAHDWIVRGFADLTTSTMQRDVWRRI
jgi:uncharacterized protein (TIGR04255 family)